MDQQKLNMDVNLRVKMESTHTVYGCIIPNQLIHDMWFNAAEKAEA